MIKIGITGSNGFIGYHLCQTVKLLKNEFSIIEFEKSFFEDPIKLDLFVSTCDVIVHLAALNRHDDAQVIYDTNLELVNVLISSLERTNSKPHLIIASSIQEDLDNMYGKSKYEGRILLSDWANRNGSRMTGLIIPNIFGPFGKPHYNSVVATFCHQISHGQEAKIESDGQLNLLYVGDLVWDIISKIRKEDNSHRLELAYSNQVKVSEILNLLKYFRVSYQENGEIPELKNRFEKMLFNTFRCYMDFTNYFPRKYEKHADNRGEFVEIARQGVPGQTSFSKTLPNVTRGNHFHTRKIERFAVIQGKALIQFRRIGTTKVYNFYLDGAEPAYVDMPIWYTHNIKNIGDGDLLTIFWINEFYDSNDSDTFIEEV